MISKDDIGILARFDGDGRQALSLYLDVSTPERRDSAVARARAHVTGALRDREDQSASASLAEDLEMVGIYLGTTAARGMRYVAIFSCASQLFWRAYPIDHLETERITVGERFDVEPLQGLMVSSPPLRTAPAPAHDLLARA